MQVKGLHDLEKQDLLSIIKQQQQEIEDLKERVNNLENRIRQIEAEKFENNVHDFTKDKNLEDTNQIDVKVNTNEKEESQTEEKVNAELLPVPVHTSLAIFKPQFLKRIIDFRKLKLALVYTFTILVVAFSLFQIGRINIQKNSSIKLTQDVQKYINKNDTAEANENSSQEFNVDFESLKKINPDTVAWIKINGIDLSFPVVKTNNNDFYLKHSFDKTYNPCGWIFADFKNKFDGEDKNIIIYGHNRKDGTMFSSLPQILNPDWYNNEENKYITLITEQGEFKYEVFSIYQIKVEEYYLQTNFKSVKEYLNFLNTLKSRSTKDYGVELNANDKILTLSTCGKENKYRVVLHAKEVIKY